jgi:hypothetical protein
VWTLPAPWWTRAALAFVGAFLLMAVFTSESSDTDTWWHLKTGQYVVQERKLPVPDPFSWTADLHPPSYPGEEVTRRFNLTHEWLSQAVMYVAYAAGGFTGLILFRAAWLTAFCALVGLVAYRRSGSFYRAIAVSFVIVNVMRNFVADRPQYFTYVFLAVTILILESRRRLWLLPPLFVIWANCHAGFAVGWVAMGAYCAESLFLRLRGKPQTDERQLWIACLSAIAASGLNPNVFNVIPVLKYYRQSPLQTTIWEWQRPKYWEVSPFTILMYGSAALLLLKWRKTRPVDWILLSIFSVSALMATRNTFLIGIWSPILIAAYAPRWEDRKRDAPAWMVLAVMVLFGLYYLTLMFWLPIVLVIGVLSYLLITNRYPLPAAALAALLLAAGIGYQFATGAAFQFRGSMWKYPEAAVDFLLQHKIQGKIFNTYGQGGYLIWRLWPNQKVFYDGRALNEQVYQDANRIGMNADSTGGKSGEQLLKDYGIDVIVMDGFEPMSGTAYFLPAALADPSQKEWKLVYQDVHDVIYMRNPPPGVPVLQSLDALSGMERQCEFYVQHGQPLCSRGMMNIFGRIGDRARLQKWAAVYQQHRTAQAYTVVKN